MAAPKETRPPRPGNAAYTRAQIDTVTATAVTASAIRPVTEWPGRIAAMNAGAAACGCNAAANNVIPPSTSMLR